MVNETVFVKLWRSLLQFSFRLLYYELAWTYDVVSWLVSLGEWRKWQQAALPFVVGERVLELGHGPGHLLGDLAAAGFMATGLDLSPYMGRMAAKNLRKARVSGKLTRGEVQALPFADGSFTTVLATFPTDYILDPQTLGNVWRVLAENGRFIVVPEGHLRGRGIIHKFIAFLFWITGQSYDLQARDEQLGADSALWEPFRIRFTEAGFSWRMEHKKLTKSGVTILIAEK